jgi:hypothetical protein
MKRSATESRKRRNRAFEQTYPRIELDSKTKAFIKPDLGADEFGDYYTTHGHLVNSGQDQPTIVAQEDDEFHISAHDIPVPHGSTITDYDGIQMTINRLANAFLSSKNRLEWAATTIRQQELALHTKECFLADYEGRERPKPLKPIPFFEEVTETERMIMISKKLVDRFGMILVGVVAGGFGLFAFYQLLFAK